MKLQLNLKSHQQFWVLKKDYLVNKAQDFQAKQDPNPVNNFPKNLKKLQNKMKLVKNPKKEKMLEKVKKEMVKPKKNRLFLLINQADF